MSKSLSYVKCIDNMFLPLKMPRGQSPTFAVIQNLFFVKDVCDTPPVVEYHDSPEKKRFFHHLGALACIPTQFVDWNVGLAENM